MHFFFSKILSTLRSKVPFSFTSPKVDSRCKSWKARCRLSVEEGQVLEDAVGIGVVDDAMYCDTLLFLSLHMWGVCLCMFVFGHTLLYLTLGELATRHFVDDVSRCERILPQSAEMRFRRLEP